jgi:hypothetical protein
MTNLFEQLFHRLCPVFPAIYDRASASWLEGKNFTVQVE